MLRHLQKTRIHCHAPPQPASIPAPMIRRMIVPGQMSLPSFKAPPIETPSARRPDLSYSEFMEKVDKNQIEHINIYAKDFHGEFETNSGEKGRVQLIPSDQLLDTLLKHHIKIQYLRDEPSQISIQAVGELLFQIVMFGLIIRGLMFLFGGGGRQGPFGMTQSVGKLYEEEKAILTTFKDVAGVDNAKQDLQEVVQFLKDGDKFIQMGARIPKGVLLIGPPGTGKTLLAKAVAGEAGVPFFSCSASEFVELFVGLGASRIRELFKKAKEKAPCIIFIDEIDAIGKKRSSGPMTNSNDEREQTINQLLTEMDGFNDNAGVIIIAATNRPELLDDALIRPGRFDRRVTVDLPDYNGRKAILEVHMKNKKLEPEFNLERIAKITIGFSGADLENLCNEAAIYAASNSKAFITDKDIGRVFDKIILGPESKSRVISENKQRLVAYHEAGHALMGILLGDYDNVRKISIVPRGNSGGVTYFEPSEERVDQGLYTREYLENQLMVILSGRIAEELKFGTMKVTTGAAQDFLQATELATQMVTEYGFNETIGPMNVDDNILGDAISADIASEVKYMIEQAYKKAKDLLETNIKYLDTIAKELIEKEHLEPNDILRILSGINCDYNSNEASYYST